MSEIDFSYCQFITEVPDMSKVPNQRKLKPSNCENLVKLHDSVGYLTKVKDLDLGFCNNLTNLPSTIQMTSLEKLCLIYCTSLEKFPNIVGNMDFLSEINVAQTAIKEFPNSIGNLTRYGILDLSYLKLSS